MSFNFNWADAFSPSFCESAKNILEGALNKGNTPDLIEGRIEVRELDMGKIPPTLALLEIGDLQADRFKGIFRLGYEGDARLVLGARVQANPLKSTPSPLPGATAPLAAHRPLLVPMALTLSNLRLKAIVVLIVSKHNGITIVFKNDPLEALDVSSTFDSISVLKGFIQKEIEGQLREMFREDLPGIIHTLSQKWFSSEASVEVERSLPHPGPPPALSSYPSSASSLPRTPDAYPSSAYEPSVPSRTTPRAQRLPSSSSITTATAFAASPPRSSFPDLEDYDPTYGLRPEGVPTHTVISGAELGKIWERNRGFGEIFEDDFPEPGDGDEMLSAAGGGGTDAREQPLDDDDGRSSVYDPRDFYNLAGRRRLPSMDASVFSSYPSQRSIASTPRTIHAVGGGTVLLRPDPVSMPTTPRLTHHVHSSSIHHRTSSPGPAYGGRPMRSSRAQSCDLGRGPSRPSPALVPHKTPPLSHSMSTTPSRSSASLATPGSSSIGYGPPPTSGAASSSYLSVSPQHSRTLSVSQGLPETISHLSQLSLSNHTLSQHTREHAHVAMRSHPPSSFRLAGDASAPGTPGGGPRKAMRKRMHRLTSSVDASSAPASVNTSGKSSALHSAPSSTQSSPPHSRRTSAFPAHHGHPPQPVFAASASAAQRPKLEPRASYGFPPVFEEGAAPLTPVPRRGPGSYR